jgi:hypothetical protein
MYSILRYVYKTLSDYLHSIRMRFRGWSGFGVTMRETYIISILIYILLARDGKWIYYEHI